MLISWALRSIKQDSHIHGKIRIFLIEKVFDWLKCKNYLPVISKYKNSSVILFIYIY